MEQQRRVRIYDRKYSKASSPDKEAFLEKNVISGTKQTMKKRETKDKITKVLRKLSSSFKLDELLNVDQNLKKEIYSSRKWKINKYLIRLEINESIIR